MFRLLALLQLTRFALAFTAIADAWAVLLLRIPGSEAPPMWLLIVQMILTGIVSTGLYGFGMTLNDLLDARRDRIFAPRRPIPSGRIKIRWAIVVAILLMMGSLFAAAAITPVRIVSLREQPALRDFVPWSFIFAFATAMLIVFYDATSKYLGGLGLVTLGAIRALHCLIGNPRTPLLFLSMFLLTHVIVVSTIAYRLENKRPRLRRWDVVTVVVGIVIGNGLAIWYMWLRGVFAEPISAILWMLIGPLAAAVIYTGWAFRQLRNANRTPREKGERLMLMGLFWLFIYDASMLLTNGQWLAGLAITLLLLCAITSFFGIRALSRAMTQPKVGYRSERDRMPLGGRHLPGGS
jgi:4-hydroxybenzoate polyprenyltransferase